MKTFDHVEMKTTRLRNFDVKIFEQAHGPDHNIQHIQLTEGTDRVLTVLSKSTNQSVC